MLSWLAQTGKDEMFKCRGDSFGKSSFKLGQTVNQEHIIAGYGSCTENDFIHFPVEFENQWDLQISKGFVIFHITDFTIFKIKINFEFWEFVEKLKHSHFQMWHQDAFI